MDWFDVHAGGVQAIATLVLVALTAYYAWASRALVRETRATLLASARMSLQARLDRVSEMFIEHPELWRKLDEPDGEDEQDGRFHVANVLVAVLEEAHTQYAIEHSMTNEDWQAWVTTTDLLMRRPYLRRYWSRIRATYNPLFARFVDERLTA
jgi:predicted RNA-binding protein